ncbi:hypothetical protein BH24CHL4_BH24CHL4_10960 [soil metagenome]
MKGSHLPIGGRIRIIQWFDQEINDRYDVYRAWRRHHEWAAAVLQIVIPLVIVAIVIVIPGVSEWANDNVGTMTAIAATVAAWYAWLTRSLAQSTKESTLLATEHRMDALAPVLGVAVEPGDTLDGFTVVIRNAGNGPAINIRIELQAPRESENLDLETDDGQVYSHPVWYQWDQFVSPLLAAGETCEAHFRSAYSRDQTLEIGEKHPLFHGPERTTQLGIVEVRCEDVMSMERLTAGEVSWIGPKDEIRMDYIGLWRPSVRKQRVFTPGTTRWYSIRPLTPIRSRRPKSE